MNYVQRTCIIYSFSLPQFESSVVGGGCYVLLVGRDVYAHDLSLVASESLEWGPPGVTPHLGRVVIGTGHKVVALATCVGEGEDKRYASGNSVVKIY